MRKKPIKKFSIPLLVAIISSFLCCNIAFAGEWSTSVEWGAQSASYSPDYGNTSFYKYSDGIWKVSPKARFQFDSNAVNAIHDYYSNDQYYYTMDISITNPYDTTKDAYNYFYSTLPSPHYDIDDDPEPLGNEVNDETEVVSLRPDQIQANTDYRFESYFYVYSEDNDPDFAFTSQESEDTIYGEYNTVYYQTHLNRTYPW